MAYALLGVGGHYGVTAQLFGWQLPRIDGYTGAVLGLSLYTFPYLFLNLRSALLGLDANLEESARSMGYSEFAIFRRIILTQLIPSLMAGWLVIGLYTLGDFGVVALMRYEVFSYAIFNQYSGAFDRIYAAWLSLMLLAIALALVMSEGLILRRRRLASVGRGVDRQPRPHELGPWRIPAYVFLGVVFAASIGLPVMILAYWLLMAPPDPQFFLEVPVTFARSAGAAMPAAVLAAAMAPPSHRLLLGALPVAAVQHGGTFGLYRLFHSATDTCARTGVLRAPDRHLPVPDTGVADPRLDPGNRSPGPRPHSQHPDADAPQLRGGRTLARPQSQVHLRARGLSAPAQEPVRIPDAGVSVLHEGASHHLPAGPNRLYNAGRDCIQPHLRGYDGRSGPFAAAIILFSGLSVALILNREGTGPDMLEEPPIFP